MIVLKGNLSVILTKSYLFLAVLGLCHCAQAFSGCGEQKLLSSCCAQAPHCGGFLLLQRMGSRAPHSAVVACRLTAPQRRGIFLTQRWNPLVFCMSEQILNQWITRKSHINILKHVVDSVVQIFLPLMIFKNSNSYINREV